MRIGIIGAGQLGQMLGFAAKKLGHSCFFLDPSANPPAAVVGPVIQAPFDDRVALAVLAEKCDVLTYEFENVAVEALLDIADLVPIYPPPEALRLAQDRLEEKRLFDRLDIPTPQYRVVDSRADLEDAVGSIGLPLVLKTRRFGYDGKGQFVLQHIEQIEQAWSLLGPGELIAEQWIDFDDEVSSIAVRAIGGDIATYSLTKNEHSEGMLRISRSPFVDEPLTGQAERYVRDLLEHLEYVGVLALELFIAGGTLYANEFAPRVHNSGHWTIEGAETSQFTNHVLAITNEKPGSTRNKGHSGMINLIGRISDATRQSSSAYLHDYGKTPRPGRKLGHITFVANSAGMRDRWLEDNMEYLEHFKLKKQPFRLTPDPDFVYWSKQHARAKAFMESTIWLADGFVVITGEVGSGKTTLVQSLLADREDDIVYAVISQTPLTPTQLLQAVLTEFGFKPFNKRKVELLDMLNMFLLEQYSNGKKVVLIVDDAQHLTRKVLEEIRLMSGIETHKEKVLRIILAGRPELKDTLDSPSLKHLLQRVRLRFHIGPLNSRETREYIDHRLSVAGREPNELFEDDTYAIIHRYSGGIPRLINTLCDTALLCTFANDKDSVNSEDIMSAVTKLEWEER